MKLPFLLITFISKLYSQDLQNPESGYIDLDKMEDKRIDNLWNENPHLFIDEITN